MMSDYMYIVGSILFCAVFVKQLRIIANSNLRDFFFWSKVFFMISDFLIMVGFGVLMETGDVKAGGYIYLAIAGIAFWTYHLKKYKE